MFRFSTTFFGRPIVQVSDGDKWVNYEPPSYAVKGDEYHFHIVRVAEFKAMQQRIYLADKHATACRKGRAKKKLPVLRDAIPGMQVRYAVVERSE